MITAYAATAPGLLGLLYSELKELGISGARPAEGGAEFTGTMADLMRANVESRIAGRILLRIASFPAVSFPELDRKLRKIDWNRHLMPGSGASASVSSSKSKLVHTGKIASIAENAVAETLGPPHGNGFTAGIYLRIKRDVVTVSLDTSGEHLHRRGYRKLAGPAPLRENLAAACLVHAGYKGSEPFLDPFCGSGTFPVEAALMAMNLAPGLNRDFAFTGLADFDRSAYEAVLNRAREKAKKRPDNPIYASDVDPEAVRLTVASAVAAGVGDFVEVAVADFMDLEAPAASGLIVTNPPYGRRLGGPSPGAVARRLEREFKGWRRFVLGPADRRGPEKQGEERLLFTGGGLRLALSP